MAKLNHSQTKEILKKNNKNKLTKSDSYIPRNSISNWKIIFNNIFEIKSVYYKDFQFVNYLSKKESIEYKKIYESYFLENSYWDLKIKFETSKNNWYKEYSTYKKRTSFEKLAGILNRKWSNMNYNKLKINEKLVQLKLNPKYISNPILEDKINSIRIFGVLNFDEKTLKIVLLDHYHFVDFQKQEIEKYIYYRSERFCHSNLFCKVDKTLYTF